MLPDVLKEGLKIVFCGTAAGDTSARLQMYYAGPGNKFWKVLNEVGFTPKMLAPSQYEELPQYGIGLTDLVKSESGMDNKINFKEKGIDTLNNKIIKYNPQVLCFNGKRAAQEFLLRSANYGLQPEKIGQTQLFVAPSTSGAANRYWDFNWWLELANISYNTDMTD